MRWFPLTAWMILSSSRGAQDDPGAGYELRPLPYPGATSFAATTTLSNGELLVYDGLSVVRYGEDGTLLEELGELPGFGFPSFVSVDPGEELVLIGESSSGKLHTLFLGTSSTPDFLLTLVNNYDVAWRSSSEVFVSAASCGFGCGSEIWRVDVDTGQATLEARVAGASGPIAVDPVGNLYYGTATAAFPPPPKPSSVLRWSAAQVDGPLVLGESDAVLLGQGFAGAAQLAFDPVRNALFLLENNFSTGESRILRVLQTPEDSPVIVEGRAFLTMGNLDFLPGEDAAFLPFQPGGGGRLVYTSTDFGALVERTEVVPLRPTATLSGPGTRREGPFDVALEHGPPGGFARILFCPAARFDPVESVLELSFGPLFLGLDPGTTASVPGLVALDADGRATLSVPALPGLAGNLAIQALVLDEGRRIVGTSGAALLYPRGLHAQP